MKTNPLFIVLTAILISAGCRSLSKSSIFKNFSLQSATKKAAYKAVDCSKGSGGDGIEVEGSGVGTGGTGNIQSDSIKCQIIEVGDAKFIESDFIDAILIEAEKEIKANGATVTMSSRLSSSEFYVEYESKGRRGKINVSGNRNNSLYNLRSEISEWTR
jgi:hypothetical protein